MASIEFGLKSLESANDVTIFCDIQAQDGLVPFTEGYNMHIYSSYVNNVPETIFFHEGLKVGAKFWPQLMSNVQYMIDKFYYDSKMEDWVIKAHRVV